MNRYDAAGTRVLHELRARNAATGSPFGAGDSAISALFEPRAVALVGASDRPGSLGAAVLDNLLTGGFAGPVYRVNPHHATVRGEACHARVTRIDGPVDLAVIVTPAAAVPGVLDDCGRHGIGAAIILSGGFREAGECGEEVEQAALDTARRYGIRFVGPNCLGLMRPSSGLNATFSHIMAAPGRVALVSQSGALCTAMLDWAGANSVGFSAVVSSGIAADIDFGEFLDYFALDAETRAIMLYVEGIRDARRFMSALRAAARAKPVVVLKAGRHDAGGSAASSHTGALVGRDDVFDAALERAGAVRVGAYSDFFAVADTLHLGLRTRGPRLAIVTNGGGPGVIAADAVTDRELKLATLSADSLERLDRLLPRTWSGGNPVDVLGDADAERYAAALEVCLDDPGVDAALAIFVPTATGVPDAVAARCREVASLATKPVLTCWMGEASVKASREKFRESGIPSFSMPEVAVAAFAAAEKHRASRLLLLEVPEALGTREEPDTAAARRIVDAALAEGRKLLDVVESKAVLSAFGLPVVPSYPAGTPDEAATVAARIGFPVAIKVHSRDVAHKTDVGGVHLGIGDADGARQAFNEIGAALAARQPGARLDGVLVEPMTRLPHGRELMLGVTRDAVFGPVVTVGLGGTLVEVLRDRAIGLPPLNRRLARRLIERTRAAACLGEFRGWPAANLERLEDLVTRLSDLVCALPEVAELDINPLVVDERGCIALDARILVERRQPGDLPYSHLAIHPYPAELAGEHRLDDGTLLTIRPIRPEDAALERAFVNGLSAQSRYLRFMLAMKELTSQMVSRFTQIDYDREMALVALLEADGKPRQIGVARYTILPDGANSEFAVVIADDWHQRGVATELMRRLIAVGRQRGLARMDGIVSAENRGMLALAKDLGFSSHPVPGEAALVMLSLVLAGDVEQGATI